MDKIQNILSSLYESLADLVSLLPSDPAGGQHPAGVLRDPLRGGGAREPPDEGAPPAHHQDILSRWEVLLLV